MNVKANQIDSSTNSLVKENNRYKIYQDRFHKKTSHTKAKLSRNSGLFLNTSKKTSRDQYNDVYRQYVEARELTQRKISSFLQERSKTKSIVENSVSSKIEPIKIAFARYSVCLKRRKQSPRESPGNT